MAWAAGSTSTVLQEMCWEEQPTRPGLAACGLQGAPAGGGLPPGMATSTSQTAAATAAATEAAAAAIPPVGEQQGARLYLTELAASVQQQAVTQGTDVNAQQLHEALLANIGDQAGRRGPLSRTSKFKGVTRHRRSGRSVPASSGRGCCGSLPSYAADS